LKQWEIIFEKIPAIYPIIINKINLKLIFFADFAFTFFIKLIGQDKPKQINMIASKASFMIPPKNFIKETIQKIIVNV
jgi:hypothetical protein